MGKWCTCHFARVDFLIVFHRRTIKNGCIFSIEWPELENRKMKIDSNIWSLYSLAFLKHINVLGLTPDFSMIEKPILKINTFHSFICYQSVEYIVECKCHWKLTRIFILCIATSDVQYFFRRSRCVERFTPNLLSNDGDVVHFSSFCFCQWCFHFWLTAVTLLAPVSMRFYGSVSVVV